PAATSTCGRRHRPMQAGRPPCWPTAALTACWREAPGRERVRWRGPATRQDRPLREEDAMFSNGADTSRVPSDHDFLMLLQTQFTPGRRRRPAGGGARRVRDLVPEGPCRRTIEAAEMFADGHLSVRKMGRARRAAAAVVDGISDEVNLEPGASCFAV